jgi:hypothetical protein
MKTFQPLKITKRHIQIALGLLWLLDGALQLQHQMFTSAFANNVIAPAGQGQLGIVSGPIHLAVRIILLHPAVFNACFALIQLALGILILWKRTTRAGLMGSVAWGLIVWYFGEGLGGLLTWQTSILMGAPGAALLYVILALAVMPNKDGEKQPEAKQPAYWLPLAWAILWIGGATLQLLPGQNTTADLSSMISGMTAGAPGWLASLQNHTVHLLNGKNFWTIVVLVAVQALIGLLVLFPGHARRLAISAGIILSLIFWFVGQGLATYYSGLATDPNTAPLFILMAVAVLGVTPLTFKKLRHTAAHDLEELIT